MAKSILLTGGSGLVGSVLTKALLDKGYTVSHLSRKPGKNPQVKTFLWDVNKGQIDPACIEGVDTVVHLAGAGIAEKRWTKKRKQEIINSRTQSIGLIYHLLKNRKHEVKTIVSASATGYYSNRGDELLTENSAPAHDFMGQCCIQWEQAVDEGKELGLRIAKYRTGVILNEKGGALPQLALPVKFGFGAPLGSGKQWIPWIHLQDVVALYLRGIENDDMAGVYNMVAPNSVTNRQLTQAVAKQLHRPLWMPKVPAFALKLVLGEMSIVVLGSTKASAQKIEEAGFKFAFTDVESALKDIYSK
jgi:uncharacterized protein (TIGR01777 family)